MVAAVPGSFSHHHNHYMRYVTPTGKSYRSVTCNSIKYESTQTTAVFPVSGLVYMKVRYEKLRYRMQLAYVYKHMHSNNSICCFSEGETTYFTLVIFKTRL